MSCWSHQSHNAMKSEAEHPIIQSHQVGSRSKSPTWDGICGRQIEETSLSPLRPFSTNNQSIFAYCETATISGLCQDLTSCVWRLFQRTAYREQSERIPSASQSRSLSQSHLPPLPPGLAPPPASICEVEEFHPSSYCSCRFHPAL